MELALVVVVVVSPVRLNLFVWPAAQVEELEPTTMGPGPPWHGCHRQRVAHPDPTPAVKLSAVVSR